MQNKAWTIVLIVFIGIFAGLSVLVGISVAVQLALAPVYTQLDRIADTQKQIELKIAQKSAAGEDAASPQLLAQLNSITQKLQNLEQRGAAQAQPTPQRPPSEDMEKVHNIPVEHSPLYGPKGAPITIVEFMDVQCPFCARFHGPVAEVIKAYPNKVSYMIKNYPLPFHPQAKPAAKAALAANEQGKYFDMIDKMLQNQQDLTEERFKAIAKELGMNVNKFTKDLKDKDAAYEEMIQKDMALAGQVDVRGTPTFYINGKKTMARDLQGYKIEIDRILSEAKK